MITDRADEWKQWTNGTPFKSTKKCVGNGEEKLRKELGILTPVGGQNSIVDLIHPEWGKISIKEMTNDDCTLGTEGSNDMQKRIIRPILGNFVNWINYYKSECELPNEFHNKINKKYGSSKTTISDGIDRLELSKTNLQKLNEIINELVNEVKEQKYESLKSDMIGHIIKSLGDKSLQELLDDCVRKEATNMTLIIVHETKGWLIVKDINKLSCPRITRKAPRINYS